MATPPSPETKEKLMLNSCRICCIIRKPVTELLRKVFEDEYRNSTYYAGSLGQQGLTLKLDAKFLNKAAKSFQGFEKKKVLKGNQYEAEWDCNLLCKVTVKILLQNAQSPKQAVLDSIRELRNSWYGHCADFYTTDKKLDDFVTELIPHVKSLSPTDSTFEEQIRKTKESGQFIVDSEKTMCTWQLDRLMWMIQESIDYDDEKHGHILELLEKMGHGTMSLEDSLKEKIAEVFQKQTETESRLSTIENLLAQIQDRIESTTEPKDERDGPQGEHRTQYSSPEAREEEEIKKLKDFLHPFRREQKEDAIQKCAVKVSKDMNPADMITHLHGRNWLTDDRVERLNLPINTRKDKNQQILLCVKSKGERGAEDFIISLKETAGTNPAHLEIIAEILGILRRFT